MSRTTHDRQLDHHSQDLASHTDLDSSTTTYSAGDDLMTVVSDIDDRIAAGGSGGGPEQLITGNDSTFVASLGGWTASGGTLTRDTTYKIINGTASLKLVTTSTNQHVDLSVSGTFTAGQQYWAVFLAATAASFSEQFTWQLGLIGTDSSSRSIFLGGDDFQMVGVPWTPTADRTGVSVRVTAPSNSSTLYLGLVQAYLSIGVPTINLDGTSAYSKVYFPMGTASKVTLGVHTGSTSSGLQFDLSGNTSINNLDNTAGVGASTFGLGVFAEHAPGDFADGGVNIEVGTDYVGLYVSEKDSSTIQIYPDSSGGYDVELKDRGSGKWYAVDASGNRAPLSSLLSSGIGVVLGGGGSVISTGIAAELELPFAGVITAARLFADQTGSIVIDVKKATYSGLPSFSSITASAKPTLSSARKSEDTTLTGWTTTFAAGDWLQLNVDSATTVTRVTLALRVRRT